MKKILLIFIITLSIGVPLFFWFTFNERSKDVEETVVEVCNNSGYQNWYKVIHNKDGTYTAWCFNYEWETIKFEM